MSQVFRPRFVYGPVGSETDWSAQLPSRPWGRRTATIGGARIAAGGTPASHVVRQDEILILPVRFYEWEWVDLLSVIEWGQLSESFIYYPDSEGTVYSSGREVWLHSPVAATDVAPTRLGEFPRVLELTIELRKKDFTPWTFEFWGTNP